jgi:hypothetical protein
MKAFYTLLFSLLPLGIYAQSGTQTIRGTIVDRQSKYQLAGAVVTVKGTDPLIGTLSDENGEFRLLNVPLGRHTVVITYLGYAAKTLPNVLVQQGKETALNTIEMEETVVENQEVVVTSQVDKTQALNEMSTVSTRQFSMEEASRYAGSLNDPSRMAANFAGVSGGNDSRNDIIIRGNSPTGLLWRLEGMPIPNPNHFGSLGATGGPVSILNYNQLANSDFMTGAFPAEYGNAVSGVFDLQMRNGNNKKREYLGQLGFNGLEVGLEGPFSKKSRASYLFNYRYSTLQLFKAAGLNFGTGAAVPQYQDASLKIDLPTAKYGRFSLFAIGGTGYIELLDTPKDSTKNSSNLYSNDGYNVYFRSTMGTTGLSNIYFLNSSSYIKSGILASYAANDITQDSVSLKTYDTSPNYSGLRSETRVVFTLQYNKKFSAKNTLHSGTYVQSLNFNYNERVYDIHIPGWKDLSVNSGSSVLTEVFSQWKHRFSEQLSSTVGLHFQHFAYNNSKALEPRVGMRWQFRPTQSLNFGAGLHNQLQSLGTYFIQTKQADGSYVATNKNLGFTRSLHLVLGYDFNFSKSWRLKTETYYQYLSNVPVEQKSSSYSQINWGTDYYSPYVDSLVNNGTGYNYGLEITIEKFLSHGFYFLSTTSLFNSKYKGSDGIERNTTFNGNYVFNLLGGKEFKLTPKSSFLVDIKTTYAGGKRYIPIDLAKSKQNQQLEYDQSNPFVDKYPDYFRADIKFTYRRESKSFTQELSLNIQNVSNHQNVFSRTYSRTEDKIVDKYQIGFFPVPQYRILF